MIVVVFHKIVVLCFYFLRFKILFAKYKIKQEISTDAI